MTRKHELQDIIRGNGPIVQGAIIQAATAYLGREAPTNSRGEGEKHIRIQEVVALTSYIEENRLGFVSPDGLQIAMICSFNLRMNEGGGWHITNQCSEYPEPRSQRCVPLRPAGA